MTTAQAPPKILEDLETWIREGGTRLDLQYHDDDGDTILKALAAALRVGRLANLTVLDLGGNALEDTHMERLATEVLPHATHLLELDLRHNQLGPGGGEALRKGIEAHCRKLRVLNVGECKLQDYGVREVLKLLLSCRDLHELHLGTNALTPAVAPSLVAAIARAPTQALRLLTIEYNGLGDDGACAVFRAFAKKPNQIRELDFSDNCLTATAIRDGLAPLLKSGRSKLERLNLSVNKLGPEGGQALAEVLADPSHGLEVLDIGCTALGESGGLAVARALASPAAIADIDLTSTDMTPAVLRQLVAAVETNTRLLRVETGANASVPPEDHRRLQRRLQEVERTSTSWADVQAKARVRVLLKQWLPVAAAVACVAGVVWQRQLLRR